MSAAQPMPRSIGFSELTPLQTFVPPTEACPIALSVLWMPIPKLPKDLAEPPWEFIFEDEWLDPDDEQKLYDNPSEAIRKFLISTIVQERYLTRFFLRITEQPPIELMRYAVMLHDAVRSPQFGRFLSTPLLDMPIVISRSPPSEEVLGKLLSSGTTAIALGGYAGLSIVPAEANPFLLLAYVSGGIICISTAAGIGRALQDGIYQRLLRIFIDPPQRKKRPTRSDRSR